ncbi:MAG: hypothetical protein ACREBC_19455 [Pyrinomonadaceae bacterium]
MAQELSCFYFPYFLVPDDLLKLGILYFDKIHIDTLSNETLEVGFRHCVKEGALAKYAFGPIKAIEDALRRQEAQLAAWKAAGLLDSGIIVPSNYRDRLDSLPEELAVLADRHPTLTYLLPKKVNAGLTKQKFKVWHTAGAYSHLLNEEDQWTYWFKDGISRFDEHMPVEIAEQFGGNVPDELFFYRSMPLFEAENAAKVARLRSVQGYGPDNCYMPAYLSLLADGVTPWVSDKMAERLLIHYFPQHTTQLKGAQKRSLTNEAAIRTLRLTLPSLSFRSFEDVLEARYLCREALEGYRTYMAQLVRNLETEEELITKEDFPKILVQRLHEELNNLRAQVHETRRAFLRDAAKRASPVLASLGLQVYINSPLLGVIGAVLGTAVAAAISAYEAHSARKHLLCGKRAHGLSFLLRLQRVL